ncbi:MAG: copper chaperone PCu(A)C [Chloroflexi bacterium]|nr:copper chaperone PCu(A)C [Chloroflexota bacterium]
MKRILMIALTLAFSLSACGTAAPTDSGGGIEISSPYAHAADAGGTSAAYMTITNTGSEADTLVQAACDAAMMVQVMETTMANDVMSMGEIPGIDLPSGSTVELKPGGYHIMLMELSQPLVDGTTITITLEFEKAGKMTVEVPVKAPGSMP